MRAKLRAQGLMTLTLCSAFAGACARPHSDESTPQSSSGQSGQEQPESREELLAGMKGQMQATFCDAAAPMRQCLEVADDQSCIAAHDTAWAACEHIFPEDLSQGDAKFWEEIGAKLATCIGSNMKETLGVVSSPEGQKRCKEAAAR